MESKPEESRWNACVTRTSKRDIEPSPPADCRNMNTIQPNMVTLRIVLVDGKKANLPLIYTAGPDDD
ncbi:hypothetical protein PROFUN_06089 [Planoprotostelium fungivorum]|uniref:Uncharacterized protein n=1 Tax=Planoprotostelium fungivorum TaxID=1890364 RepID=A0A2P6NPT4_9EUKA|nr:hypothetical protein PROFUN_06089 [Planoprotostelium fungivorum]